MWNIMHIVYDLVFIIFALVYLPFFLLKGKFHRGVWQRLGYYGGTRMSRLSEKLDRRGFLTPPPKQPPRRSVWIHAVSVGEVAAVRALWERLREEFPSKRIVISTVTKSGNELALGFARENEIVLYLPFDISFIVNKFLNIANPVCLVIAETEIWPNLIYACHKKGIPVALVNGRISDRAFKRYRIAGVLLRFILDKVDIFCAQTEADKKKFALLGAPEAKVKVTGNTKYDNKDYAVLEKNDKDIRARFGIGDRETVIVAGSTHKGEEEAILNIFRRISREFGNLRLIIAPRHIERAAEVKRLAGGLNARVIDKIGILVDAYSVADIVFVGGSLVRHGGQNIIEPAVFGKPVIFGPHMFNFQGVAAEFLRNEAALMVEDARALEGALRRLLRDGKERARLGENARKVVLNNQGAVLNCLAEIRNLLR